MKLCFNKRTLEPKWFLTTEVRNPEPIPNDYTDKVPLNTFAIFNEDIGDWEYEDPLLDLEDNIL